MKKKILLTCTRFCLITFYAVIFLIVSAPAAMAQPASPNSPAAASPSNTSSTAAPTTSTTLPQIDDNTQTVPLNQFLRENKTVKDLWTTILRIADVFVALFFLGIAFATILHINYDTYGVKKAILPLLIGILLSHFSLLIVQNFVDFGQILAAGMYNAAAGGAGAQGLANNISKALFTHGLDALGGSKGVAGNGFTAIFLFALGTGTIGAYFLGLFILALIMLVIPTVLILVLSFLLYARFYVIVFLTILAPLAWLTIMWSPVQGFFKNWWKQFTQWVFMAPVTLFFIWLAIVFSQSAINNGTANFGTYLLTLVMLYLAIRAPFMLGGQIMSAWGKFGRERVVEPSKKAAGAGGNKVLDTASMWKVPGMGGKTLANYGIMSPGRWKKGLQQRFAGKEERVQGLSSAAIAGMGVGWGKRRWGGDAEREKQLRQAAEAESVEKRHWGAGLTQDNRKDSIRNGSLNSQDALKLIELMAQKGEDAMGALEEYIKNKKYGNGKDPRDSNADFAKRWNNSVMYTKPWFMKAAVAATPAERADLEQRKQGAFNSMKVDDIIKQGSYDAMKIRKYTDTTEQDEVIQKLVDAQTAAATSGTGRWTDNRGNQYAAADIQVEINRIDRIRGSVPGVDTMATATHIGIGQLPSGATGTAGDAGDASDLARHIRSNPSVAQGLKARHASGRIRDVADEV